MSSSNCCFLTCIQISQKAGQVVWCSRLFQNFPQFIVIHSVKDFGIVKKAEIDVFLELSCFFDDPADVGNLISGSSAFSKTSLNIWKFTVHILLKPWNPMWPFAPFLKLYSPANTGSIPGLGRSPGERHGNSLQYSCLENPMDRGDWWATVHRITQSWTQLNI